MPAMAFANLIASVGSDPARNIVERAQGAEPGGGSDQPYRTQAAQEHVAGTREVGILKLHVFVPLATAHVVQGLMLPQSGRTIGPV